MQSPTTRDRVLEVKRLLIRKRESIANHLLVLAAVDTAGGVLSFQNPYVGDLIIIRLVLDITTPATGACSMSFGTTAVNGTTSVANLIDTLDVHSAGGLFDNVGNGGTNGKKQAILASGGWLTGSVASGASAGIVGNALLHAIPRY